MGIIDRVREALRPTPDPDMAGAVEAIRDLSLQLEDRGWTRLGVDEDEMTFDALVEAARDGRTLAVAHPLVRRGLALRATYVHGSGGPALSVSLGDDEDPEDVAAVVRDWWDSPENAKALTGPEARARLDRSLSTDGNVYIAAFTRPRDGAVICRTVPFEQITAIHSDPEDRMQVRFYERTYTVRQDTFSQATRQETVLYPDLSYSPRSKPKVIEGRRVLWDQPIRHVKVNDLDGWQRGIGDTYSIAPFARGYRDFLTDWLKLTRSLSQFAWRATADGKRATAARQALARTQTAPGNPNSVGATMVMGTGESLEAIPKTGATIDADSGRPLLSMIAAGLDVPVTMLSSDPGVTGARATAETLDEPMYRAMQARRDVWAAAYRDLAAYAIEQAVRAPQGPLVGTIVRDDWADTDRAILNGAQPRIVVAWPDLSTSSVEESVKAIATADATGKLPPLVIARLLLTALGVDDADRVLADMTDEQGRWIDPARGVGDALIDAFQRGEDPSQLLNRGRFPAPTTGTAESIIRGDR